MVLNFVQIVLNKHEEYTVKLDVPKIYLALSIVRLELFSLFLIFGDFEPRGSYEIVFIKNRVYLKFVDNSRELF